MKVEAFDPQLPCDAVVDASMVDLDGQVATFVESAKLGVGRVGPFDECREFNLPRGGGGGGSTDIIAGSTGTSIHHTTTNSTFSAPMLLGGDILVGKYGWRIVLGRAGNLPTRAGPFLEEGGGSAALRHPIEREGPHVDGLDGLGAVSSRPVLDGDPRRVGRVEARSGFDVVGHLLLLHGGQLAAQQVVEEEGARQMARLRKIQGIFLRC